MRASIIALVGLLAWSGHTLAGDLPPEAHAALQESKDACKPDRATLKGGFVSTRDVNADGIPDYILNYRAFQCGDNSSYFCGSAGCLTQVFASAGGRFAKVLDENVQTLDFKTIRGRPAMLLGLHGSACGKIGAQPCGTTLYWNGSKFQNR